MVMKYRHGDSVVEAIKFDGFYKQYRHRLGANVAAFLDTADYYEVVAGHIVIMNLDHQEQRVHEGDWIIREPDGNFYVINPDLFAQEFRPEDHA